MLPRVDFPETAPGGRRSHRHDDDVHAHLRRRPAHGGVLDLSVCALLLSEACNVRLRRRLPPHDRQTVQHHRGPAPPCTADFLRQRGELRHHYREGKEDQIGALGLVIKALVLFNARYMDAALTQLSADGSEVRDHDGARLSPFVRQHINMLGQHSFQPPQPTRRAAAPARQARHGRRMTGPAEESCTGPSPGPARLTSTDHTVNWSR
ncbi:transposase [Streptomyces sp. NBC_01725]